MAVRKRKREVLYANVVQLDPISCGSIASCSIVQGRCGPWADIDLTDCNHKIGWNFEVGQDGLRKAEVVHKFFTEFLQELKKQVVKGSDESQESHPPDKKE